MILLAIEIIIWVMAMVYGILTLYRIRKAKKQNDETEEKLNEAVEDLMHTYGLPNNDFGQIENEQNDEEVDETISNLIELSVNKVTITLSSLIRTLYDHPDYALSKVEKQNVGYGEYIDNDYKAMSIVYNDKNKNRYNILVVDSKNPCLSKKAKIDDQVLIVKIEKR